MEIIPITDRTESQFRETCPDYSNKFIIMRTWLNEKKITLPCFNVFGFDAKGNLYEKHYLVGNEWCLVKPNKIIKENEN